MCSSDLGYRIFGQVINRVAKNADFGHKEGKGFGKWAAHPHSTFLEEPAWANYQGSRANPLPRARRSLESHTSKSARPIA